MMTTNNAVPTEEDDKDDLPPLPSSWQTGDKRSRPASPGGAMPGSAWLDATLPLPEAAEAAHRYVMDELTPDDQTQALVLYDDRTRATTLAAWLTDVRGCRRVLVAERLALQRSYPFLFYAGAQSLVLPNEIVPGRLYLGSAQTVNEQAMRLLRITAVLSLLDRQMKPLAGGSMRHLLIRIPDVRSADMDGALLEALPFLEAALSEPDGRVLVHCEAGQSRSATVVVAALMANVAKLVSATPTRRMPLDDALTFVREQRPCVRPNDGFLACLRRAAWMPDEGEEARPVGVDFF